MTIYIFIYIYKYKYINIKKFFKCEYVKNDG